jgi:arylsulfatase
VTIFRLIASLTYFFSATAIAAAPRPNIVLIVADDMGYSDIGCYGGEIETPNLDRMAAEGLRFSQFYNASVCGPTRASLKTGLYHHQVGVHTWNGLRNDKCVNLGEALQLAGYRTMMVGKWTDDRSASYEGFDRALCALAQKGPGNYFKNVNTADFFLDKEPFTPPEDGFYKTDAYTDYAIQFMEEAATIDKPFFLYAAYPAPHWPLHAKEEDITKYRKRYREMGWDRCRAARVKRLKELGIIDDSPIPPRDAAVPPWTEAEHQDWEAERMAVYAAQIDCMDQNIGRLLDTLKTIGREENTVVIFLSDNGATDIYPKGTADGSFHLDKVGETWRTDGTRTRPLVPGVMPGPADTFGGYGPEWAHVSNTPLRGYKISNYEGGISTPLIVKWPGGIARPGTITPQVGHVMDMMPTLLELAGGTYPSEYQGREILPMEGKSLAPIFAGAERAGHEALFWELNGHRAARKGDWKIVAVPKGPWELYDLATDRGETNDLVKEQPEKLDELVALYTAWSARCNEGR